MEATTSKDRRLERLVEDVAEHVGDAVSVALRTPERHARLVPVEADHLGHQPVQVTAEHALAAADVERPLRPCRHGVEHHRVQMDVVVPPVVAHAGTLRGRWRGGVGRAVAKMAT